MGIFFVSESVGLLTEAECKDSSPIAHVGGETSKLSMKYGDPSLNFDWIFTIPDECRAFWKFSMTDQDVDGLVSYSEDVKDSHGVLKTTMRVTFTVDDT